MYEGMTIPERADLVCYCRLQKTYQSEVAG